MKMLLPAIVIVLLAAFYVAWPAWSGYQIYDAIETKDAATLDRKIDFPSVRVSLRSAAKEKTSQLYVSPAAGPSSPILVERLKQEAVARIVERSLEVLVTADNLIRVTSESGPLKDSVERMLQDQIIRGGRSTDNTGAGSVGASKRDAVVRTVSSDQPGPVPHYGLRNVKHFGMVGPFRFAIGVAKDAAASEPDVTVEMSFTGLDWKVTAVRPRL
jgi:Protein of unknown function (DUF2939)